MKQKPKGVNLKCGKMELNTEFAIEIDSAEATSTK